jgi:hypothetical protein
LLNRDDALVSEWPPPRATNLLAAVVPRANNGERQTRVARRPRRPRLADRNEVAGAQDFANGSGNDERSQVEDES